jgi:hypothetical protein
MRRARARLATGLTALVAVILAASCSPVDDGSVGLPYSDEFDGDCAWADEDDGGLTVGCDDGVYRLTVTEPEPEFDGSTMRLADETESLAVEATMEIGDEAAASGDFTFGITCLADVDPERGYAFLAAPNGDWAILRTTEGERIMVLRQGALPQGRTPERMRGVCAAAGDGATVLTLELDGERVAALEHERGHRRFAGFGLRLISERPGPELIVDRIRAAVPDAAEVAAARDASATLVEEDFSSGAASWATLDDETVSLAAVDGAYRFRTKTAKPQWSLVDARPGGTAIAVESDAILQTGGATTAYGVVCYGERDDEGYNLAVSYDGRYSLIRERRGELETIEEGDAELPGGGLPLRLRAACATERERTRLALFVNGEEIASAEDDALVGRFEIAGLYVKSDAGGATVVFDDFRAERLEPGDDLAGAEEEAAATDTVPAGETLFRETFSQRGGAWPVGPDPTGRQSYERGAYRVVVSERNAGIELPQTLTAEARSVAVEATFVQLRRSPGEDLYGVGCVAGETGFVFQIDAEKGAWSIGERGGGSGVELVSGRSPAIRGPGARNRLRGECRFTPQGGELLLSVNGRRVKRTERRGDFEPFGGLLLVVDSFGGRGDVLVDDIVARSL